MIFFKPTYEFVDWLVDYAKGRLIIDVGAGECYLLKTLATRNAKCLGVDPYATTEQIRDMLTWGVQLVPMEAENFSMCQSGGNLLVIARPCHDGFPSRVAHNNKDNEILYIGLNKNKRIDFPHRALAKLDTPKAGEDGERVWRVV